MKQLNVSKKVTAPLMVWVSIVLIAATLLFSFMPIMSFDASGSSSDIIEEVIKGFNENADIEIPEKIDISVIKLINSVKVMGKIIKVAGETVHSATDEDTNMDKTLSDAKAKLDEISASEEGKEAILVAAAVIGTFKNAIDFEADGIAMIFNLLLILGSVMFVFVSMFIIPIKLIIMFIKNLILAIKNRKTPEAVASTISGKLPELLAFPFVMMLLQTFIPGMVYSWGIVAMCYTIGFSVLFCTVITRLRTYEGKKFVYLNVLQGTTVVAIVGFFVFFFNILKTNVVNNFLNGKFADQIVNLAKGKLDAANANRVFEPNKAYILDFVLMLVFAIVFLSSVSYISSAANKLSCTVDPKHQKNKLADCKLVGAILMLVTYIVPKIVSGNTNFYNNVESKEAVGDASFLVLQDAELAALNTALIGIIIMIVAEVALIILKKVLCKELTALEAGAIVCGVDSIVEETETETETETEEAPANEEAPAETPAEEAPAEEAPVAEEVSAE